MSMSENNITVGRIEQLTVSPEMKDRWKHNVQVRIADGKTINTSCVLAAQARIDMLECFLEEAHERLTAKEQENAELREALAECCRMFEYCDVRYKHLVEAK